MTNMEEKVTSDSGATVNKSSNEIAMDGLVKELEKCDVSDYYARGQILSAMKDISNNEIKKIKVNSERFNTIADYVSDNWGLMGCAIAGGVTITTKLVSWFKNRRK